LYGEDQSRLLKSIMARWAYYDALS
jgi:hypothetical protein